MVVGSALLQRSLWKVSNLIFLALRMRTELTCTDKAWDPLDMKLKQTFSKRLDTSELAEEVNDRSVIFALASHTNPQMFRKGSSDIPRDAGDDEDLQDTLTVLLGITGVSVSHVHDDKPINTLDQLWEVLDLTEEPFFWLHRTSGDIPAHHALNHHPARRETEQSSMNEPGSPGQNDYSNHPILELECELEEAADDEQIHYAQPRFSLIRENHRCSAYLIQESKEWFSRLDQMTSTTWQRLLEREESIKKVCEDLSADLSQDDELSDMIAELSVQQRPQADSYVTLIKSKSPLATQAVGELVKLLMPDAAEWGEVSRRKRIFDKLRENSDGI